MGRFCATAGLYGDHAVGDYHLYLFPDAQMPGSPLENEDRIPED